MDSTSIKSLLEKRRAANSFRELRHTNPNLIDFSSNDYLGLAQSDSLKAQILEHYQQHGGNNGATGSRLLTGNTSSIEDCEAYLANHFNSAAATLFSSGYMANLAFFSSVPQKGDIVFYDELSHACIKDGLRLSFAKRIPFKHNDLQDLERKLTENKAEGQAYIACESIYSMDGDLAPLAEITTLATTYNALVVVDEAHSTGSWGENGSGLVNELGLHDSVYAVIYTFGKAMGIHGACVTGTKLLKDFFVNFARPFIYTTAPSAFEVSAITSAFEYLKRHPSLPLNLSSKSTLFNQLLPNAASPSAIKSFAIGGNEATKEAANTLQMKGFDVRPILSPTVKEGSERLRICLHAFNLEEEVEQLARALQIFLP
ncbi:aminotransferase class I/II-fold pyridoxal phosphate-dependent enzyme [Roseivirga pacifica]|uniref:aminotransferase class I/II-fold pyridoxal phosphate-dependent enzyme n=1 Tax=Roseivirga pacifica TaxID=1267423 RepID=UPI002094AADD|nr:pyridoxal phosphate-dependent aminotransferase family protein [Roseivirga pacifica]MCO6358251.1 aminotransferase class I/II-fold pyridoxal phosphate-dependent enzyme [Roseivirga pacifica]MCO6366285.1 aminotransferase class I/II-fold pyridoxal phosphate-dependent enzyme [Roseivirga pacifica]MCO6369164.1 aminotransferase class I/II-fold pyridoxal phosphate-dependent enzyme [Roseivirga pacifica]MCO6373982.1 aminotransferase class I/II-fold pyridoxal phosphate-dependent enzyme [Roseivirga pacifi